MVVLCAFMSLFDLLLSFSASVLQIESLRKLKIELDCTALVFSSEYIEQFHVDFGAIKRTISWVYFILFAE